MKYPVVKGLENTLRGKIAVERGELAIKYYFSLQNFLKFKDITINNPEKKTVIGSIEWINDYQIDYIDGLQNIGVTFSISFNRDITFIIPISCRYTGM